MSGNGADEGTATDRRAIWAGLILAGIVIVGLVGWRVWYRLDAKPVSDSLFQKVKAVVEKQPRLQPDWDAAMADGVLTWTEAKAILDKAGEKAEPQE